MIQRSKPKNKPSKPHVTLHRRLRGLTFIKELTAGVMALGPLLAAFGAGVAIVRSILEHR